MGHMLTRYYMLGIIGLIVIGLANPEKVFGLNEYKSIEKFSIQSLDGLTTLHGQIDFPFATNGKLPLVVMIPGTGLFDRDVEFGNTGTEKDLIFKQISGHLTKSGFAVLRYDYRGIDCSRRTVIPCKNCKTPQEKLQHYLSRCINNEVRATVTPENLREDIAQIYEHGANHSKIDSSQVIAFGHSEGSLNLSHLARSHRISPKAFVFMGGLAESPASIVKWQMTDRIEKELFSFDSNFDGILTNEEIVEGRKSSYLRAIPIEELTSDRGFWTRNILKIKLERDYVQVKDQALGNLDTEPFGSGGVIQASMRWWKMFFSDWRDVIDNFVSYDGFVSYHNGDNDSQTNFDRQKQYIDAVKDQFLCDIQIQRYSSKGHTLSGHAILGPIPQESMDLLISDFIRIYNMD